MSISVGINISFNFYNFKIPKYSFFRQSIEEPGKDVRLNFRDNFAVLKIENASKWHTGKWRLRATNPIGSCELGLHFLVRSEPDPPPEAPEVEEISEESGTVTLTWQSNPQDQEIYGDIQYQVEYNRETWDIWLKVRMYYMYHECCRNIFIRSGRIDVISGLFRGIVAQREVQHCEIV